jgi:hypothetical protein
MAISGLQTINIGLPNESAGSDSLYTAFNKTKTNFSTLFGNASPYNTFNGNTGISVTANSTTGTVDITNSGVTNIIAGTNITVNQSNGNVTISSTGGGGGGTVTSVGVTPVSTSRLVVTNSPIVSSGSMTIDLVTTGVTAGTYTYPTVTVDSYGRIINASNASSVGTVTSVAVSPGTGIQVTGSPITTNGTVTITNTGVTRLTAGTGVSLSGSTGNVTISALQPGGTVTSVNVTSPNQSLSVSGGPITTVGTITLDLSANVNVTGNLRLSGSEDLSSGSAINLEVTASYFSTSTAETATLAAGADGQIKTLMMVADGGDMVITVTNAGWKTSGNGTITFNAIGDSCILQYIASKWFVIGNNGVVLA